MFFKKYVLKGSLKGGCGDLTRNTRLTPSYFTLYSGKKMRLTIRPLLSKHSIHPRNASKLRYAFHLLFLLSIKMSTAQTWTPVSAFGNYNDIWGIDASNIWVTADQGLIRKYNGTSWNVDYGNSLGDIYGIHGTSATNIWAAQTYYPMLKYNGTSWSQEATLNDVISVWTSGSSNVWVLTLSGEVWHYNGASWTSDLLSTFQLLDHYDIWGASPSNIRVVANQGQILQYNGSSWYVELDGSSINFIGIFYSIWGADASNVWAVGTNGTILKYDGFAWDYQPSGTTETLLGVWGTNASNVWAVGENGTILKYNGTSWTAQNSGVTSTLTGIWGTGNKFWVCGKFPGVLLYSTNQFPNLPVELAGFQAQLQADQTVQLHWQTASERNNKGFDIEHSTDGKTWVSLGFVAGKGTTSEKQTYQFTHGKPSPGTNYYRLAQQDFDGAIHYSDIRNVVLEGLKQKGFSVFPNPVMQGELTVQLHSEPEENATISIYTSDGRLVLQQPTTANVHTFDTHGWTPGTYFIEIKNGAQSIQEQVVIK